MMGGGITRCETYQIAIDINLGKTHDMTLGYIASWVTYQVVLHINLANINPSQSGPQNP